MFLEKESEQRYIVSPVQNLVLDKYDSSNHHFNLV